MSTFIPGDKETSRGRAVRVTAQVTAPCPWLSRPVARDLPPAFQLSGPERTVVPAIASADPDSCLCWRRGWCPLHRLGLSCCSA